MTQNENNLHAILDYNQKFVETKQYEQFRTSKFPNKKMVILTCMDTRLVELLPKAMNFKNGDVKLIKNAGAIVTQPFGNIMRSIIVAIYMLGAEEVFVVGHHECGMTALNADDILSQTKDYGISPQTIDTLKNSGIQLKEWLRGFDSVRGGVENSVSIIRNHPLLPDYVQVHGMIIDPATGQLELVSDGSKQTT